MYIKRIAEIYRPKLMMVSCPGRDLSARKTCMVEPNASKVDGIYALI